MPSSVGGSQNVASSPFVETSVNGSSPAGSFAKTPLNGLKAVKAGIKRLHKFSDGVIAGNLRNASEGLVCGTLNLVRSKPLTRRDVRPGLARATQVLGAGGVKAGVTALISLASVGLGLAVGLPAIVRDVKTAALSDKASLLLRQRAGGDGRKKELFAHVTEILKDAASQIQQNGGEGKWSVGEKQATSLLKLATKSQNTEVIGAALNLINAANGGQLPRSVVVTVARDFASRLNDGDKKVEKNASRLNALLDGLEDQTSDAVVGEIVGAVRTEVELGAGSQRFSEALNAASTKGDQPSALTILAQRVPNIGPVDRSKNFVSVKVASSDQASVGGGSANSSGSNGSTRLSDTI